MKIKTLLVVAICYLPGLTFAQGNKQINPLHLSSEEWKADLKFFSEELPKKHANAFHYISREQFDSAVAKLSRELYLLNDDEVYVRMNCIAKMIGDGHTYIKYPSNIADFPIAINQFDTDYRITHVQPGFENALGARVLEIEQTPISKAIELVLQMTPLDEHPNLRMVYAKSLLTTGLVLHGFGIIANRNIVHYKLVDDAGNKFSIEVHADSLLSNSQPELVCVYKTMPLFRQNPQQKCWSIYLPDSKTVYCNVRSMRAEALRPGSKEMLNLVKENNADKLVIDLRQNPGGDYFEGLKFLVTPIKELPTINKKGHLYVLIGPLTFSAAMSNSAHFRNQTEAILVGESIGEKPNSYSEPREIQLPNSKLTLRYSTQFYKFVEGDNIIKPDREIKTSWADYQNGVDPVLEWVIKQQ